MRHLELRKPSIVAAVLPMPQRRAAVLLLGAAALAAAAVAAGPAYGQVATDSQVFACTSQQELEQTMQSDGSIVPDGCRTVSVNTLSSEGQELCLLNFDAGEEDILGQLQEAALPSEWWVECDALAAAIAD
jgi:hypothetical protein